MKSFSWPYRILFLLLVMGTGTFYWQALNSVTTIRDIVENQDAAAWERAASRETLERYSQTLVDGLIKLKFQADLNKGKRAEAFADFQFAKESSRGLASKLGNVAGFRHLLCGTPMNFPDLPAEPVSGCWALDGTLRWQSPARFRVDYVNPQTGWTSSAIFHREGLADWKLVDIELPVEAVLEHFFRQASSI